MRSVRFIVPLRVETRGLDGKVKVRPVSEVSEEEADWQWVQPMCLQIQMWGSKAAKLAGQAQIKSGKTVAVDVYVTPATNVLQVLMPDCAMSEPSAVVQPSMIHRPH